MKTRKRVNDLFGDYLTNGGIFSTLQLLPVPWQDEHISLSLDLEYHANISGHKFASPLLNTVTTGETLLPSEKMKIAEALMAVYGKQWQKLYDTLDLEYNPIENYNMVEKLDDETETTYGHKNTRTDLLTEATTTTNTESTTTSTTQSTDTSATESTINDTTETTTRDLTDTTEPGMIEASGTYGFNSLAEVPTGSTTQSGITTEDHEGTNTVETDGEVTVTKSGSDETESSGSSSATNSGTSTTNNTGTQELADSGKDHTDHDYTLTRTGNIGVTTSQQMIESERNLWKWNFFHDVVFPDIDHILTLSIY